MKKSNIVMTALGAAGIYAGRRVSRSIATAITKRASTVLINTSFKRYRIRTELLSWMRSSPLISDVAGSIFGDKTLHYITEWTKYNGVGPIISIDGVVCYLGEGEKLDSRYLYVPKLGCAKVDAILTDAMREIETVRKADYCNGAKFTLGIDEKNVHWRASESKRPVFLDDMPIASHTRAILRSHIDRVLHEWRDGDISYTRNLLFHGPKGGGKSHITMALANELDTAIAIMPAVKYTDQFIRLVESASGRHWVIVVDEAESLPVFCPEYTPPDNAELTTRDMLDYFSGIGSPVATMTVVCTNDPNKLDERFRRTGRFKEEICIDKVDSDGIQYWVGNRYNYTVPASVKLRPTRCNLLFDMIDTLDSPEALVKALTVRQ